MYGSQDYGSQSEIPESEKLLRIQISETGPTATSLQSKVDSQEDTIDSLRERLRAKENELVDKEIQQKILFNQYEKLRTLCSLSDDPQKAKEELAQINAIRLGLIPSSNQISSETQEKSSTFFLRPVIVEMAKDILSLGLMYDAVIVMGTLIKAELNKVDVKTKVKIQFEAKIKATEVKREEPKTKPGRRKLSPNEVILKSFHDVLKKTNPRVSEEMLFAMAKPTMLAMSGITELQLATLVTEFFKGL